MIHFFLQNFIFIVIHLLSEYSICVILKGWGPLISSMKFSESFWGPQRSGWMAKKHLKLHHLKVRKLMLLGGLLGSTRPIKNCFELEHSLHFGNPLFSMPNES